jgi:ATP-dependent DNA helicase RecG
VVIVEPSSAPPLRYDGRTWIRVGSTTRLATAEAELILTERRQAANLPFDAKPVPSATIADLDLNRFREEVLPQLIAEDVLQENHRPIPSISRWPRSAW